MNCKLKTLNNCFLLTLKEKINKEILNSKLFSVNADENIGRKKNRFKTASAKARALMNLHNNEAGRRVNSNLIFDKQLKFNKIIN